MSSEVLPFYFSDASKRESVQTLQYLLILLIFEIATQQLPFSDVLPIMVPAMVAEGKVGDWGGTGQFREYPYTILVLTCKVATGHNSHTSKYQLHEYMNAP